MKRLLVCLVIAAVSTAPARAGGPVRKVLLKNGLRLITQADRTLPLVGVCVGVGAGPAQEDAGAAGLSRLLALSLLDLPEAHPRHKAFEKIVELSGNDTDVDVQDDTTLISLAVPADVLDRTLEVIAERLREPGVAAETFDELRARLQREAGDEARNPLASFALARKHAHLAYGTHPHGRPPEGTEASLKRLTREQLAAHQKKWWTPNNVVIALAGDVDPDRTLARAQELFGALPAAPVALLAAPELKVPEQPRKEITELAIDRTAVRIGWLAPPISDPDAWAVQVLRGVLADGRASRLRRRLMDRGGRATEVTGRYAMRSGPGLVSFHLALTGPDVWPVVDDVLSEVERLRRVDVGPEELARAKAYIASQHLLAHENLGQQATLLARLELIDDVYTAESWVPNIEQVTAQQVRQAAVKWLDPARVVVSALRPKRAGGGEGGHRTQVFTLPGGLTLSVRQRAGTELAGVCALVRTDMSKPSLADFALATMAARMLSQGATRQRNAEDTAGRLESLGSKLRGVAAENSVILSVNATQDTLDDVLGVMREILTEPRLAPAELVSQRALAVADLKEKLADDDQRGLLEVIHELVPERPGPLDPGAADALARVSAESLSRWFADNVVPARVTLAISSSAEPEKIRDLVASQFAGWTLSGAPAAPPKPLAPYADRAVKRVAVTRPADHLLVAWRLPPESNRNFAAVSICVRTFALGKHSILHRRMAQVDPAYQFLGVRYSMRIEGATVFLGFRLEKSKANDALKALDAALAELADPGPPAGELADTRDFVTNLFLKEQQSRVQEATSLAVATGMVGDAMFFEGVDARYKAVSPADVKRAAGYFKNYRAILHEGK